MSTVRLALADRLVRTSDFLSVHKYFVYSDKMTHHVCWYHEIHDGVDIVQQRSVSVHEEEYEGARPPLSPEQLHLVSECDDIIADE